jgi:predicted amidophosphoribosyltransferase
MSVICPNCLKSVKLIVTICPKCNFTFDRDYVLGFNDGFKKAREMEIY